MISRKTRKHLRRAGGSGRDALHEAAIAGAAGARALRGGAAVLGKRAAEAAPELPKLHPPRKPAGLFGWTAGSRKPGPRPHEKAHGGKVSPRAKAQIKQQVRRKQEKKKRAAAGVPTVAPLTASGWWLAAGLIIAWSRIERGQAAETRPGVGVSGLFEELRRELTPTDDTRAFETVAPGRGRGATSPAKIPARGWRDILKRTWGEFNSDRITAVAGGVTFFGLLALFPAMAAFVSLYGLFADSSKVGEHLRVLAGVMPAEALKFFGEQMLRMAQAHGSTLSLTFFTTLLISLWSANAGVKALFDGLNVAYEEKERRSFIKLNLVSLAFTVGGIAFLALAAASVIAVPIILGLIGVKLGGLAPVLDFARWPLLLLGAAGGLAALYRYGPSRAHPRWRWITPGSLGAALLWLAVSMLFSFYVAHFGSYNKTYGSLGAVVGFMTWIWLSIIVVLFGAELNSEIEHQTAVDTTTGTPRPLGARGAKVADEVAA